MKRENIVKQFTITKLITTNMIYEIQTFDLKDKTLYVGKERPELQKVKGEHGQPDYFVNASGVRETPVRSDIKLVEDVKPYKNMLIPEYQQKQNEKVIFLPYFADVTEDLPGSCKFPPQTYKNCQLLRQKHGGYLEFFDHETKKTLRIALNSNTYTPVK